MTDDLLKGLGRAVREEEAKGERLDALAERLRSTSAQASSPEAKSLDAAALGVDEDAVRAAYAPLSAEQKARLASQLAERIRATAGHTSEGARAKPLQRPRAPASKVWLAGGALASAALVALWLGLRPGPQPLALASYELDVQGSAAVVRGDSAPASAQDPLRVRLGSPLTLVLSPERAEPGQVVARAYVQSVEGISAPAQRMEAAASGAVRLSIDAAASWPASGTLIVWVGRPEVSNKDGDMPAAASPERGPGYQRFARQFVRVP
jgi:hypothetical protein